jgi:hypothetical protein
MTVIRLCDFCGREIRPGADRVALTPTGAPEDYLSAFSDYHDVCWWEVRSAIRLVESVGGGLEHLPLASQQAISAMRRRHRRPPESETS